MIKAEIIADSINKVGIRLTTFVLTYPRFIHSEFMTHRMFSRNASSSRAIPVKKQIEMVANNPAIPLAFTKNQKGMQGGEALDGKAAELAEKTWMMACFHAMDKARMLADLEVHKQYANRILEPFSHITVVCTSTDYANFFALRCHKDAQPEIQALADEMYKLYSSNEPKSLEDGEWHLPFIDQNSEIDTENDTLKFETLIKKSVARCARVSYLTHDGKQSTTSQDVELYNRLVGSTPIHASPAEHQAMATSDKNLRSGNFRGWVQYRQTLNNQNIENFHIPQSTGLTKQDTEDLKELIGMED